jgi:protease II
MGYQLGCYTAKLEWASSADGTAVPFTLAYRTELMKGDGSNKAVLHG